jgi:PAS domain S-box-containing protein
MDPQPEALLERIAQLERQVADLTRSESALRVELDSARQRLQLLFQPGRSGLDQLRGGADVLQGIASALHETMITGYDRDGNYLFTWVPPELEQRCGILAADFNGKSMRDVFPPEEAEARIAKNRQIMTSGQPHREEYLWKAPTGEFWHDITLAPLRDPDGQVVALVGFIRDITERKRNEQELMESEQRYRAVVEQTGDVIIIHRQGSILFANQAARDALGVGDAALLGHRVLEFVHPDGQADAIERLAQMLAGKEEIPRAEQKFVSPDGRVHYGEVTTRRIQFGGQPAQLAVVRDITERKRFQERMLQTQKAESLGLLARGVAHDFNNLLLGILGHTNLLQHELAPDSPLRSRLGKIEATAVQAAELTRQLLAYSGGDQPLLAQVALDELVREMADLLEVSLPADQPLQFEFEPDLPPILAEAGQVRQVVMNLILNAAEAIAERGRVTLRLRQIEADRHLLAESYPGDRLAPGSYVQLEVEDDGCGMSAETRARIFDPFFTTKISGRGLGLAAVLGIVRAHRGAIRVDSQPQTGTCFRVLFPAAGPADSLRPAGETSDPG